MQCFIVSEIRPRQDSIFNTHRYSFHSYKERQVANKNTSRSDMTTLKTLHTIIIFNDSINGAFCTPFKVNNFYSRPIFRMQIMKGDICHYSGVIKMNNSVTWICNDNYKSNGSININT